MSELAATRPNRAAEPWTLSEASALLAVMLAALVLRLHDFALAPLPADNRDELDWAWSGLTLITRHVPYGWSNLLAYQHSVIFAAAGTRFRLVHPFLDHPPLFSLLVGGWAWLRGARELVDVNVGVIRAVPIALSLLALLLAYMLLRRLFVAAEAMAGSVLLATSPVAVLFARQVEAESLLAIWFLLALLLMTRVVEGETRHRYVVALCVLALVSPFTKITGVALAAAVAGVLITLGRWRAALAVVLAGTIGAGLYVAYGYFFDGLHFFKIVSEWQGRRYGTFGAYEFISAASGLGRAARDGFWVLGWMGLAVLLSRSESRPRALLAWPVLVYAGTVMLLAEDVANYGWFRITVYPVVYGLAGVVAWRTLVRPSAPQLLLVLLLGGATAISALAGSSGHVWQPTAFVLTAMVSVVVLPSLLHSWRPASVPILRIAQGTTALTFLLLVLFNVVESFDLARVYTLV